MLWPRAYRVARRRGLVSSQHRRWSTRKSLSKSESGSHSSQLAIDPRVERSDQLITCTATFLSLPPPLTFKISTFNVQLSSDYFCASNGARLFVCLNVPPLILLLVLFQIRVPYSTCGWLASQNTAGWRPS